MLLPTAGPDTIFHLICINQLSTAKIEQEIALNSSSASYTGLRVLDSFLSLSGIVNHPGASLQEKLIVKKGS